MARNNKNTERLSLSFHQTFVPERHYLSSLMKFAVEPKEVNMEQIADATGIPTGESSGKIEPTINYAKGMGLLEVSRGGTNQWKLLLSALGRVVLSEDQFMSEGFTQWILHLKLCRVHGGAEAWYAIFADSDLELGRSFSEEALKTFLVNRYGKRSNVLGPVVRMYNSEPSFASCGALVEKEKKIERVVAPCETTHMPGYRYLFFSLWDQFFENIQQVDLDNFDKITRFFATNGWSLQEKNRFLDCLADEGLAKIDRQTGHALVLRTCDTDSLLKSLYSNLL